MSFHVDQVLDEPRAAGVPELLMMDVLRDRRRSAQPSGCYTSRNPPLTSCTSGPGLRFVRRLNLLVSCQRVFNMVDVPSCSSFSRLKRPLVFPEVRLRFCTYTCDLRARHEARVEV